MSCSEIFKISGAARLSCHQHIRSEEKVIASLGLFYAHFILYRYEIHIKDLSIVRNTKLKEEINRQCSLKILYGNTCLDIDSSQLDSIRDGITLDTLGSMDHDWKLSVESSESKKPCTVLLLLYKNKKLIGEGWISLVPSWTKYHTIRMRFDHIEVPIIEPAGPSPSSVDYNQYIDLTEWGSIGRRADVDSLRSEYIQASSVESIGVLSITLELVEINVNDLPPKLRDPHFILYKRDDEMKQVTFFALYYICSFIQYRMNFACNSFIA